ncbi:hypothetical protein MUG87_08980 [Ectobacillus sp. JY-23]|uniref:hypothetical protein n=1 Tax=Ectobacillus sp. JY-23 TaxID=2933872 RepID=UPI001FF41343|nr:hypothetical protein [Ectobacillus sp. JY-23]UOY94206.1 hypothetical protein MUG87_08980 [Ectobacillus sp. JY-23]
MKRIASLFVIICATLSVWTGQAFAAESKFLQATKAVEPLHTDQIKVGTTLRYHVMVRSKVSQALAKANITDRIPAGTEYVPGSMKLDGVPLTDAVDQDAGRLEENQIIFVELGSLKPLQSHKLTFDVTITKKQKISNRAFVQHSGPQSAARIAYVTPTNVAVVEEDYIAK